MNIDLFILFLYMKLHENMYNRVEYSESDAMTILILHSYREYNVNKNTNMFVTFHS